MQYVQNIKQMNGFMATVAAKSHVGRLVSMPSKIIINLLDKCNFNCRTCCQDHNGEREFPKICLDKLEQVLPFVRTVNLTGGEPLMYTHLSRLFDLFSRYEVDVTLGTNASLMTERRRHEILNAVTTLKVSVDGGTPESYNDIRQNGNYYKVMMNIAKLSELKAKVGCCRPQIQFNFVALRSNVKSLKQLIVMAAELGVSQVNVIYSVCWNDELAQDSLYFHQEMSDEVIGMAVELGKTLGVNVCAPMRFASKERDATSWLNTDFCDMPFTTIGFSPEGKATFCCGQSGRYGDLVIQSFDEIWNHKLFRKIRETVNTDNEMDICRNCTANKQDATNIVSHIPNPVIRAKALAHHGMVGDTAALAV